MKVLRKGCLAVALVALIVAPPIALWSMGLSPQGVVSQWGQMSALTSPLDTPAVLALLGALGWCAWAWFVLGVVVEIGAMLTGRTWEVPGFAIPQGMVRRLFAASVMVGVGLPGAAAAASAVELPQTSAVVAAEYEGTTADSAAVTPLSSAVVETDQHQDESELMRCITVGADDTLWDLAEKHLGDGMEWSTLHELNKNVLHDPDLLEIGMLLKAPAHATGLPVWSDAAPVTERPAPVVPEVVPDLPAPVVSETPEVVPEVGEPSSPPPVVELPAPVIPEVVPEVSEAPPVVETPSPVEESLPEDGLTVEAPVREDADVASAETSHEAPAVSLTTVTTAVASVALVGGLWWMFRRLRDRQQRRRLPGTSIPDVPEDLEQAESELARAGALGEPHRDMTDKALRHLHSVATPFPAILNVLHDAEGMRLRLLAQDVSPPEPWVADDSGFWWRLPAGADIPDLPFVPAPLPGLVTVGQVDDQRWMVDLETHGVVNVTGGVAASNLVRHMVAELATHAHTDYVSVVLVGWGEQVASCNPERVSHFATVGAAHDELKRVARDAHRTPHDLQTARLRGDSDFTRPTFVVVAGEDAGAPELAEVREFFESTELLRTCTGMLIVGETSVQSDVQLEVDDEGKVLLPDADVRVEAASLPADEAEVVSTLLSVAASEVVTEPAPGESGGRPWEALVNADGGLRVEYTQTRLDGPNAASVLPSAVTAYTATGATLADDVRRLGKVPTQDVRDTVEEVDPSLRDDLAEWHGGETVPCVTLLGTISLRVPGAEKPKREKYLTEVAALLATHPAGLSLAELASALGIAKESAKEGARLLRRYLGDKPDGGEWLPPASERSDGVKVYRFDDAVLVDADLCKRLRLRAEAGGSDAGLDLQEALALVSGRPLTPPQGYTPKWMATSNKAKHLVAMVQDIAHVAVLRALSEGNKQQAAQIAERIAALIPGDIQHLDVIAAESEEYPALSGQRAREDIVHAGTGDELPDDPTARTSALLTRSLSAPSGF